MDLVFTQSALNAVHVQISSANGSSVFGAMVGRVFEDPTCARRWARIEGIVPSPAPVPEAAAVDDLTEAMGAIQRSVTGETVLGWYRTHHEAGLYLSPEEGEFHERQFSDPSGFALIVAGQGDRLAGGVFQRTDPDGLSRSVYTPFYELADDSAKLSATTRRTTLSWTNYQTETRVVRPGEPASPTVATVAGLQPHAPPTEHAHPTEHAPPTDEAATATPMNEGIPAVVSEAETGAPPVAPEQGSAAGSTASTPPPILTALPSGGPNAPQQPTAEEIAEAESQREAEAEWEKIQIQRSLMAVGRSLGPSTISELGAPAHESTPSEEEEKPADDEAESRPVAPPGPEPVVGRPELTVVEGTSEPEPDLDAPGTADVIPISAAAQVVEGPGLVGRSRRRRPVPVMKIAMAAAGVTLMLGAGWIGTRALGAPGPGVADGGEGAGESAVAGMSIAPGDMFGNDGAQVPEPGDVGGAEEDPGIDSVGTVPGTERPADSLVIDGDPAEALFEGTDALATVASAGANSTATGADARSDEGGAAPIPSPLPPQVVEAPVLDSLEIVDPALSAFETALSIFRSEIDRYEEVRREFDDGLSTCNPLNLAFRGVIEAHGRLERRHGEAQALLSAERARAHTAANRQYTVTRTHYELTDCPMPVGG